MTALTKPPTSRVTEPTPAVEPERGDPLAELVRQHQAPVWRYLRYLGAQNAEADDLTQETFLAVARAPFQQRTEAETAGYLRAVARNQLLMLRRKQRREPAAAPLEAAESVWAASGAADRWDSLQEAAKACVEKLAERSRQAIDLAYRESAPREAIAERLGMKPDGVKSLLRRARAAVRECIERTLRAA